MINRSLCTKVPPLISTHHVERCGLNMMRWAGKASEKFQKTRLTQLQLFLIYSALWLRKWCDVPRITSLMGSQTILMILNTPITNTGPIHWRPSEYEHPLNTLLKSLEKDRILNKSVFLFRSDIYIKKKKKKIFVDTSFHLYDNRITVC
jgi:hypothetical protein